MSKEIFVFAPNGRKQKVKCLPDTTILQVLEDVCKKQGFDPRQYGLKHHKQVLDLTMTMRFSNLPNKACLEMVEMERKDESNVTIRLQLENGERRTGEFPPNMSLYELLSTLASEEVNSFPHPTVLYMRQEIHGKEALQEKTLRQLGLISGRAVLRLLNKSPDELKIQANVSSILVPRVIQEKQINESLSVHEENENRSQENEAKSDIKKTLKSISPEPDHPKNIDFVKLIKQEINKETKESINTENSDSSSIQTGYTTTLEQKGDCKLETDNKKESSDTSAPTKTEVDTALLERRLNIDKEVTFLGSQKAIAFTPEDTVSELEDLPDDFYELSIEEVRKLYHDLHKQRLQIENAPLLTSDKRQDIENNMLQEKESTYKNVVVRVQFPDGIILQGVFETTNTINDVTNFIKEHLRSPDAPFQIFTTPFKETFNPNMTLSEAKFVPCVLLHFKRDNDEIDEPYLKEEIYLNKTPSDAASILASKYRAPSRRKIGDPEAITSGASTSKNSKLPKWFKL